MCGVNVNESQIILKEIRKQEQSFGAMAKTIIIKINKDNETNEKNFDIQCVFDDEIRSIESTSNVAILNVIMQELLNQDYFLDFECEIY